MSVNPGFRVPYADLAGQHAPLKSELFEAIDRVLSHGQFILGEEVDEFEAAFAALCGVDFAIGVGNGTDALMLALHALGVGSGNEVITVPNSFLASASSVALAGATPVIVDVGDDYNIDPERIEAAITPKTRAILPVHLTGRIADMDAIDDIATRHGLPVVEDAAQAVAAEYRGRQAGSFGVLGCFSFHPLKTLNVVGDGGAITTNDPRIAAHLRLARNHGLRNRDQSDFWAPNSRLDTIHAAMLIVKLRYLKRWTEQRRAVAAFYQQSLADLVEVPVDRPHERAVYHTFVIQADRRDELHAHLQRAGVEALIHYPTPIHLQQAAAALGHHEGDFPVAERQASRILSLPIYAHMTAQQQQHVVRSVREFYGV